MASTLSQRVQVDVGIFAHNEGGRIGAIIRDLAKQDVFESEYITVKMHILANGCSDQTVADAEKAVSKFPDRIASFYEIYDIPQSGKSRTWNTFVHVISRRDTDVLILMDGDVRIHAVDALSQMISSFSRSQKLQVVNSRPVKDLALSDQQIGLLGRVISLGGGALNDWRKSICGQLYAVRAEVARRIWMPIGLPVEDGFLRAMILTDFLTGPEDFARIDGVEGVWHEYESENTIGGLVRHQQRIIVGSAINAMLFGLIRRNAPDICSARAMLEAAAQDDSWLACAEQRELPTWPYGYVPFSFLTKRLSRAFQNGSWRRPSAFLVLAAGMALDALVYCLATIRLATRGGANHW